VTGQKIIDNIAGGNLSIGGGTLAAPGNAFTPNVIDADLETLLANKDFGLGKDDRPLMDHGGVTDYYVDPNGNNNNPGTQAQPFQTIQQGVNRIPHIVTGLVNIHINDGNYTNEDGTVRAPMCYFASPKSMVAIGQDLGTRQQNLTRTNRGGNVFCDDIIHTGGFGRATQYILKGVEWDGQQLNGAGMNISVDINGYAQNTRALGTKSGHFILEDCVVGDNNHDHALLHTNCPYYSIIDTNLIGQAQEVQFSDGGEIYFNGTAQLAGNNIDGMSNQAIINAFDWDIGNIVVANNRLFIDGAYYGGA